MAKYSKEQSTVIGLWVLALKRYPIRPSDAAPEIITGIVNKLGDVHSPQSVLLHKHGYDRLLLGRKIDKTITTLQRRVAKELHEAGIAEKVYDV